MSQRTRVCLVESCEWLSLFALLSVIALLANGCGSVTPTQQSYAVRLTFNGAGHEAIDLRKAGKFPDPGFDLFVTGMNAFAPQLDLLDSAAAEAESAGSTDIAAHYRFTNLLKSVNAYINDITAQLLAQRQGRAPATRP